MPYRLKHEYEFTHAKTGKPHKGTSYFSGFMLGCPVGTSRAQDATIFATKNIAEVYARNKLRGRGYKPERVAERANAKHSAETGQTGETIV